MCSELRYNVLFLCVVGTIWCTFKSQVENLDRNRFTIIAWDPPGYGKSRPPTRKFNEGYLQQDAIYANDLMKALGYDTFSLIGSCNGGITSCILAAMYPDSVRRMILISANSYILPEELKVYRGLTDLDSWNKRLITHFVAAYGKDYLRSVWTLWVDAMEDLCDKRKGIIRMELLEKIQCPTLIVHGEGDKMVKESHAVVLGNKIRNSRLHIFKNGRHEPQLGCAEEFNDLATRFLSSSL